MDNNFIRDMLALIDAPAFAVLDGSIVQVNSAAQDLMISAGTPLEPLLAGGKEAYEQFEEGSLSVTVQLGSNRCSAMVRVCQPYRIFKLEGSEQPELNALALAARQLRLPLSDLSAGMNMLYPKLMPENDEMASEYAAGVNRSFYRILRQVENMADVSRYSSQPPRKENTNVSAVVGEVVEKAATLAQAAGKQILYRPPQSHIFTAVDREQLVKSLYALLANALKFTAEEGIVRVSLTSEGKLLHLSVEDNGGGIPEEKLPELFRRYSRKPGIEDPRQGIGLGLAMVRSFATAHDGSILLRNTADGLKLTVTLPVRSGSESFRSPALSNPNTELDQAMISLSESLPSRVYKKK